ncbi:MAG: hypothetical protein ACRDRG_04115 [Pseudonocardiaceae bacterium]
MDYVTTAAGVIPAQGVLAALLSRLRGHATARSGSGTRRRSAPQTA